MHEATKNNPTLGIGALSQATGIPVETLRTWERRYGFPNPKRSESGHRIYAAEIVDQLKLIDASLKEGHRASKVVGKSVDELHELLGISSMTPAEPNPWSVRNPEYKDIQRWLRATFEFDGEALETAMRSDWMALGALAFLTERVHPFLVELGRAWVEHRMEVAHEHFASERLRDFLTTQWRPISDRSRGPRVICATLPGETHYLGLQMATMIMAINGFRIVYLGSDTPVADIVSAATSFETSAVVISVSVAANRFMVTRELSQLRGELDPEIQLVVGGLGAPDGLPDVNVLPDLDKLGHWADTTLKSSSQTI